VAIRYKASIHQNIKRQQCGLTKKRGLKLATLKFKYLKAIFIHLMGLHVAT
jgi:hypothetical protein